MNHVVAIEDTFSDRIFTVPDYQRGYAWERRQREEFLEDLEDIAEGKEHYTGTLVLHARPDRGRLVDEEGKSYGHYDVVDGQQRLTTVVVLLDAIARTMAATGRLAKLAEGTRKTYVAVRDLAGQLAYKLRLDGELHGWFTETVLAEVPAPGGAATAAQARLLDAHREFTEYVEAQRKSLGEGFEAWLLALREKVTRRLKLTVYEVGNEAEVGVIFEVMNNRGRPLTELEKVKNYVLYLSTRLSVPGDSLRAETNRAWARIFENLMEAGLGSAEHEERLLRAHWLATRDHDARRWEGSRSIKARYKLKDYRGRDRELLADLHDYVRTLRDASVPYRDVYAPSHPASFALLGDGGMMAEARAWGERLKRTWVTAPFLPVLIAARLRAPQDGPQHLDLLRLCELYGFRIYRWGGFRANTGQSALHRLAFEHYVKRLDVPALLGQLRGLLLYYHPESRFESELALQVRDADNDWYTWAGLRYFLYEWEGHCAGRETVRIPWHAVHGLELAKTVEHILPQSATDPYWQSRFTDADRRRYTHDLGNLVLTSHNGSLSNRDFDRKKGAPGDKEACYSNSLLASERELAGLTAWTSAELLARRERMVAWARDRWRVIGAAPEPVQPEPDDGPGGDE